MNKREFLDALRAKLSGLPQQDVEERLEFYGEMIDDRVEEGRTEEEAVLDFGSVDEISAQIIADIPLAKIAKERSKPKSRLRAWEIVLLVLGSPIWLPLAIAAAVVILSLYVVLWSVIASVWAVFGALVGCAVGALAAGVCFIVFGHVVTGIAMIGASLICAGVSIFLFFGCKAATKGIILLTKLIAFGIKKCFVGKEGAQ